MNWLSGGNWDDGISSAPLASWTFGDTAVFGGTFSGTQTVTLVSQVGVGDNTIIGGVGSRYLISLTGTSYNQLGVPSGTLTIEAGSTLSANAPFHNAHNLGAITLNGGTLTSINGPAGPANDGGYGNWITRGVIAGGSSLSTISSSTLHITSGPFTVSDAVVGAGTDLLVSSKIIAGNVVKDGPGTMELTAANTPGTTTINSGTLKLNGAGDIGNSASIIVGTGATLDVTSKTGGFILNAGQTINGSGTVMGGMHVTGTLAPGTSNASGTLTINSTLNLNAGATVRMRVSKTGGTATNDKIRITGATTLGGNLVVTDVTSDGNLPAAGDTYTLFDAEGGSSGAFASVTLPILPGGLIWDTSLLASNGQIKVVAGGVDPTPFRVASLSAATDGIFVGGVMTYHFSTAEIPTSVLAADAPERRVYFGNPVPLTFTNAVPGASYRIELVYASDSARVQTLTLNGSQLGASFTLAAQSTGELSRDCGIATSETLAFVIAKTSGPNAVVSSVNIYSSDPTSLTPPSTNINLAVPRLSPLPATVAGVTSPTMNLNGTWQFRPAAPSGFPTNTSGTWSNIQVPGEWVMQGFSVASGTSTAYRRSFDLPPDWAGKRVKLRFDAVYSSCNVWVNGQTVGSHSGGFTPFELDVTSAVHAGTNSLELTVLNESEADSLASGSTYAAHQLGGITRKVTLFAAPSVNVSGLHVLPQVAADSLTASAEVRLAVANEGTVAVSSATALVELCPIVAGIINPPVAQATVSLPTLQAGASVSTTTRVAVPSPRLWHPEKPNLYIARVTLQQGGVPVGTTTRRFGLRRIEIVGNRVFVNGAPVKLAGVCRHEVHPLLGRSLTPEWWRLDAQRFVEMNANLVRTSHYPPAEEFIDLCDELGLFVEEEAPFCWANSSSSLIQTSTLEMANRDLSHPSILFWSLANESTWDSAFANASTVLRQFDPSRPQTFNYWNPTLNSNAYVEIQSTHYPSPSAPAQWAANPQPINFGEYSHLYVYDRRELLTDPGLRDFWGPYHASYWESMWQSQAVLGGSIWAAIDDTFFIPQLDGSRIPVGYGGWGPLDGWRRPKPEYWHSKRAYSPLRLLTPGLPAGDAPVTLQVENRHTMTALNELTVDYGWLDAAQNVNAGVPTTLLRLDSASCSGAPSANGSITIPAAGGPPSARQLYIRLTSPRGFVIDEWLLRQAGGGSVNPPDTGAGTLTETASTVTLGAGNSTWTVNKQTGLITQMTATSGVGSQTLATSGPFLMLLPSLHEGIAKLGLTSPPPVPSTAVCSAWSNVSVTTTNGAAPSVRIQGTYSQAGGAFTLTPTQRGLTVDYDFTLTQNVTPRQIGLVFELPGDCPNLAWRRDGELDIYPPDHIGRPVGQAVATHGTPAGANGPASAPTLPWALDLLPQGNNDFRSTKKNIRHITLSNATGYGLQVLSDGSQSSRAWLESGRTRLLVADFNNGGSPDFFKEQLPPPVTLSAGSHVSGQVFLAATTTPAVVLSDLANGTLFGVAANIPLSVSVATNGHLIDRVQYYSGATLIGEASAPPYSILWSAAAPGAHDIRAVVRYAGGSTSSLPVNIRVLGMPVITNTAMSPGGSFQLGFTGPPGQTFRVLATDTLSTLLEQWTEVATGTIDGSGAAAFSDPSAATRQRRFYRIASP